MTPARSRLWSSVGKKLITGLTGVLLTVFIILHVAGNLTLFVGGNAFNGYSNSLHHLGWMLYAAELGLFTVFGLHAVTGLNVWLDKRHARTVHNTMVQTKGRPSRQTLSSRTMAITGAVLLVFTIVHLITFRFGPGESEGYVAVLHGERVRDLYRLVVEKFQSLPYVAGYMGVMIFLGFHLRHGFWSAWQSLGLLTPRLRPAAFACGIALSIVVAAAFFLMPIYIYLYAPALSGSTFSMESHP